jgi:hypothetical protein
MNKGDLIGWNGSLRNTNGSVRPNGKSIVKKKSINEGNWMKPKNRHGKAVGNGLVWNPLEDNSCRELTRVNRSGPGRQWPNKRSPTKNGTKLSTGLRATYQNRRSSILQSLERTGWCCQEWIQRKSWRPGKRSSQANVRVWDRLVLRISRWTKAKSR